MSQYSFLKDEKNRKEEENGLMKSFCQAVVFSILLIYRF